MPVRVLIEFAHQDNDDQYEENGVRNHCGRARNYVKPVDFQFFSIDGDMQIFHPTGAETVSYDFNMKIPKNE